MPNGRSGGFIIDEVDLRQLLAAAPIDTPVGLLADEESSTRKRVDALELLDLLGQHARKRYTVEEQDHAFYVIHLREIPTFVYLSVTKDSPISSGLAQRHAQSKEPSAF
jgi:hypothetical protein